MFDTSMCGRADMLAGTATASWANCFLRSTTGLDMVDKATGVTVISREGKADVYAERD
jgi:hypothetical protein